MCHVSHLTIVRQLKPTLNLRSTWFQTLTNKMNRSNNNRSNNNRSGNTMNRTSRNEPIRQRNPPSYSCGICFETITRRKRFGLLSSCDHVFCYDCLKKWRENDHFELDHQVPKRCPACREFSEYMVASDRFVTGFQKNKLFPRPNSSYQRQPRSTFQRPTNVQQQQRSTFQRPTSVQQPPRSTSQHPITIQELTRQRERQREFERERQRELELERQRQLEFEEWERFQLNQQARERAERAKLERQQPSLISQTLTMVGYVSACVLFIHWLSRK